MSTSRPRRLALALLAVAAVVAGRGAGPAWAAAPTCAVEKMPGLGAAWGRYVRVVASVRQAPSTGSLDDRQVAVAAGAREELLRVVTAVLGLGIEAGEDAVAALERGNASRGPGVECTRATWMRDRLVSQMVATGYSGQEIVDVLTGRLDRSDIDHARRLLMAGFGERRAADYLDEATARRTGVDQRSRHGRSPRPPSAPALATRVPRPDDLSLDDPRLDSALVRFARLQGVDPTLIRAMVSAESGGQVTATSQRGALGLMQLMPATARMLGVDPRDPYENLRGGIAYLAGLVRQFGDVRSALVAYNAGPTHAERVRRGDAALYGETRRYLERIAGLTGVASYLPGR